MNRKDINEYFDIKYTALVQNITRLCVTYV